LIRARGRNIEGNGNTNGNGVVTLVRACSQEEGCISVVGILRTPAAVELVSIAILETIGTVGSVVAFAGSGGRRDNNLTLISSCSVVALASIVNASSSSRTIVTSIIAIRYLICYATSSGVHYLERGSWLVAGTSTSC
jgi:hypothetical protein